MQQSVPDVHAGVIAADLSGTATSVVCPFGPAMSLEGATLLTPRPLSCLSALVLKRKKRDHVRRSEFKEAH